MLYIFLSVIIALTELSLSFLFVNYLQEIYLFELYKTLGFSVNLGYFVSIVIFVIIYFLFSWTFNEIFGKNINYLAIRRVKEIFEKQGESVKHVELIRKTELQYKFYGGFVFVAILLIVVIVLWLLEQYSPPLFLATAGLTPLILAWIFSKYNAFIEKRIAPLKSQPKSHIIRGLGNVLLYSFFRTKKDASVDEIHDLIVRYKKYIFLLNHGLIKVNIENSTKNTTILVFLYFLLGCFFFWITRSMDTVIVIKHEVKLILQIITCFIPIILFATYIGKRRFYMFQYQKLMESEYARRPSLKSQDLSIDTRDNRYDTLAIFEICVFFLSGLYFLFHQELGVFIPFVVIANIIFIGVRDYQAK